MKKTTKSVVVALLTAAFLLLFCLSTFALGGHAISSYAATDDWYNAANTYCMKCGTKMELDFGQRFKRSQCLGCKLKFRYKEGANGELIYDFKIDDVKDLYIAGADGAKDERFIDIAKRNTERTKE